MVEHPLIRKLVPGSRVRITQVVAYRHSHWPAPVEGEVLSCGSEPAGSWYAHGKHGRYWLARVVLRKPNGELTRLSLDQNSRIELMTPNDSPPPNPHGIEVITPNGRPLPKGTDAPST